jgi:hypothetical protein
LTRYCTPAKSFGKRFWIWTVFHSLSNNFYEVSEQEKTLKQKILLLDFEIMKNHVQFLLHSGLKQSKAWISRAGERGSDPSIYDGARGPGGPGSAPWGDTGAPQGEPGSALGGGGLGGPQGAPGRPREGPKSKRQKKQAQSHFSSSSCLDIVAS